MNIQLTATAVISNVEYDIPGSLDAFISFYKLIIGLNLQFPPESAHVWHFIEKFVFNLHTSPTNNTQVLTLVNEFNLNRIRQQS